MGMSWCVKKRGPVFTSAFSPLTQIVVAIFDFSVLRERIYLGRLISSNFNFFLLLLVCTSMIVWFLSSSFFNGQCSRINPSYNWYVYSAVG